MFGVFIADGDDVGNACVLKNSPTERVGIVCRKAGKYEVVEYSELSDVIANMRDAQGNLVFGAGFICNLWCTVEFLRTKCNPPVCRFCTISRIRRSRTTTTLPRRR